MQRRARSNCLYIPANLPVLAHMAPKSAGFENAKLSLRAKMKIANFLEAKNCHRQIDHAELVLLTVARVTFCQNLIYRVL